MDARHKFVHLATAPFNVADPVSVSGVAAQFLLSTFQLTPENYTLTQLRYHLRKLKAHALLQRDGHRDAQVRDKVDFDVLDEVAVQGVLVIPKGSVAWVRSPRLKPSAEWLWK